MAFKLYYTRSDGTRGYASYHSDCPSEIRLPSERIQSIDLSRLSGCSYLHEIILSNNHLQSINLGPLANCESLQYLDLSGNRLESIDITPLGRCVKLRWLYLGGNQLEKIDLTPLASCQNLRGLILLGNSVTEIDLRPLSACKGLWSLYLGGPKLRKLELKPLADFKDLQQLHIQANQLQDIDLVPLSTSPHLREFEMPEISYNRQLQVDLTPLTFCEKIFAPTHPLLYMPTWLENTTNSYRVDRKTYKKIMRRYGTYQRPSRTYPWRFLHRVVEKHGNDFRVQQDILTAMGLEAYGFIDVDLKDHLLSISPDASLKEACDTLKPILSEQISIAAKTGGSTTGLKLEELVSKDPDVARSAPQIIQARNAELDRLRIGVREVGEAPLAEIFLTAYGYDVLSAVESSKAWNSSIKSNMEKLEIVERALAELGFALRTDEENVSGVKMSDNLKSAVLWIFKNRGRLWEEILE